MANTFPLETGAQTLNSCWRGLFLPTPLDLAPVKKHILILRYSLQQRYRITVKCSNKYKSGQKSWNLFTSILYNLHLTLFLSFVDLRLFYSVLQWRKWPENMWWAWSKFLFIKHTFCIFILEFSYSDQLDKFFWWEGHYCHQEEAHHAEA